MESFLLIDYIFLVNATFTNWDFEISSDHKIIK